MIWQDFNLGHISMTHRPSIDMSKMEEGVRSDVILSPLRKKRHSLSWEVDVLSIGEGQPSRRRSPSLGSMAAKRHLQQQRRDSDVSVGGFSGGDGAFFRRNSGKKSSQNSLPDHEALEVGHEEFAGTATGPSVRVAHTVDEGAVHGVSHSNATPAETPPPAYESNDADGVEFVQNGVGSAEARVDFGESERGEDEEAEWLLSPTQLRKLSSTDENVRDILLRELQTEVEKLDPEDKTSDPVGAAQPAQDAPPKPVETNAPENTTTTSSMTSPPEPLEKERKVAEASQSSNKVDVGVATSPLNNAGMNWSIDQHQQPPQGTGESGQGHNSNASPTAHLQDKIGVNQVHLQKTQQRLSNLQAEFRQLYLIANARSVSPSPPPAAGLTTLSMSQFQRQHSPPRMANHGDHRNHSPSQRQHYQEYNHSKVTRSSPRQSPLRTRDISRSPIRADREAHHMEPQGRSRREASLERQVMTLKEKMFTSEIQNKEEIGRLRTEYDRLFHKMSKLVNVIEDTKSENDRLKSELHMCLEAVGSRSSDHHPTAGQTSRPSLSDDPPRSGLKIRPIGSPAITSAPSPRPVELTSVYDPARRWKTAPQHYTLDLLHKSVGQHTQQQMAPSPLPVAGTSTPYHPRSTHLSLPSTPSYSATTTPGWTGHVLGGVGSHITTPSDIEAVLSRYTVV